MNPVEMDQLVRRANAAGFPSIADYTAHLEDALRYIERRTQGINVGIWAIATSALAGNWQMGHGEFIDSSKERT